MNLQPVRRLRDIASRLPRPSFRRQREAPGAPERVEPLPAGEQAVSVDGHENGSVLSSSVDAIRGIPGAAATATAAAAAAGVGEARARGVPAIRDAAHATYGTATRIFRSARQAVSGQDGGLPSLAQDASATAISVADAAKRSMIERIRERDDWTAEIVETTAREAVYEAASVGADVTAAAIGAVSGAVDMARLRGANVSVAASVAATAAIDAANELGPGAAVRVREAIERRSRGLRIEPATSAGLDGNH